MPTALLTQPAFYLTVLAIATLLAAFWQIRRNQIDLRKKTQEINQRVYETQILQAISERIGYELNIGKILDTIIESLDKLIPYTVVSYMLIRTDDDKLTFRLHVQDAVSPAFVNTIRDHMLENLNKFSASSYKVDQLIQQTTGTIIDDSAKGQVASLWVTPLLINSRGIGVLAVASKQPDLYRGSEMEMLIKILAQANHAVNNLETVIAQEQKKMNAMVASMVDGVIMLDKDLNLLVINQAATALLGLPVNKKTTIFDIAASLADKVDLRAKIDESSRTGHVVVFDNLVEGNRVSQIFVSPVKDTNGTLVGSVVLFHDITAQKQLEQVRQDFTAMMVHELRAPLTVVRGTSDMLIKNPQLVSDIQGKDLLKMMQNSAGSMLDLVNDLLDVAKIESGKFQIIKTPGNLSQIIKERVDFFSQLAAPKGLTIVAKLPAEPINFSFDKERVAQVLNNLLSNAIKFTHNPSEIAVSAQVVKTASEYQQLFPSSHSSPDKFPVVIIAVSDHGEGIASEDMPILFSKYKQLRQQHVKDASGTGLGLVISKGIVESHGGKINVNSKVAEGSTFYFSLPLDN